MGVRIFGWLFSVIFALGGGMIGYALREAYTSLRLFNDQGTAPQNPAGFQLFATVLFVILGALLGFLGGSVLYRRLVDIGKNLKRIPVEDKIAATLGTLLSLLVAALLAFGLYQFHGQIPGPILAALILMVTVLVIWLGNIIALSMKDEVKFHLPSATAGEAPVGAHGGKSKLLDTNVIIDGRIYDICRTGFLDGPIILPGFVLEELQHIADSADALRRNRGRRGLDILHQMQHELDIALQVMDRYKTPFAIGDGVDMKLVKLAKVLGADIITNDFNLNKVAKLHGVRVLNINELANAVKPVVLPGEELTVTLVKEGKEYNQGVGYLDDGTMVVVENGKPLIGETVPVAVSSVLQTVAGKMIFAETRATTQEGYDENSGYIAGRGGRRKTP
jgi:uncharacterized protein YacL